METLTEKMMLTAQKMVDLCVIVYNDDLSKIPPAVEALGLQVVWGPVQAESLFHIPYSALFVAQDPASGEHVAVIRGTQFDSLWSWIFQDFDVEHTVPFHELVPSAPGGAAISRGTYNGIRALLSLFDKKLGLTAMQYLSGVRNLSSVSVTGHSLGGTLTFPLGAYIKSQLAQSHPGVPVTCTSFAGLTPGNGVFAQYLDTEFPAPSMRYVNPYDIAPNMFDSLPGVENIYVPTYPWHNLDFVARDFIKHLFNLAEGKDYTQPSTAFRLPGSLNPPQGNWRKEAEYQHHSTTYRSLVGQLAAG